MDTCKINRKFHLKAVGIIFIVLLSVYMITDYAAADGVDVWAVGDCYKINPVTGQDFNPFVPADIAKKNYLWDSGKKTVALSGAKNEYVAFQIIVDAKGRDLKDVTVVFSDISGPSVIPTKNIKLFKAHYTNVWKPSAWPLPSTGPGEYPDALIPFDVKEYGAPFSIAKNRNQAVWVDLYIPKDISAGDYKGTFTVYSGDKVLDSIDLSLSVWDFALPDENHLICWANYYAIRYAYGLSDGDPRYFDIEKSIWKLCHEHRLDALSRSAQQRPKTGYTRDGKFIMNAQSYIDWVRPYLDGSLFKDKLPPNIFLLPMSGGTEPRWPRRGPAPYLDDGFIMACKEFAGYFRENGWDLSNSYVYLSDEPDADKLDLIVQDAKLVHDADKDLKTMVALFKVFNEDALNKLSGSVDFWLIDASYYKSDLLLPRKKMGEKIGFYQQSEPWCGNESLDSDGLSFVTWPWIAWKYGCDCIYLYSMTEWGGLEKGHTVWDYSRNKSWSNSQGVLIYPGNRIGIDSIVGSIRLKQIRRGMQDYEYMYLAKEKGKDSDKIVDSILDKALDETKRPGGSYGEWSRDPEDWNSARHNLARLIMGQEPMSMKTIKIPPQNATNPQVVTKPKSGGINGAWGRVSKAYKALKGE